MGQGIGNRGSYFMNLALNKYADNPIIDELVDWSPNPLKVKSMRGSFPVIRKPFVEIEYADGEFRHRQLPRSTFVQFWSEAVVIIGTITDIELISEFKFAPVSNRENLIKEVLASVEECINESNQMFTAGMYQLFLDQYGVNYKCLPPDTIEKLAEAKNQVNA